MEHSGSRAARLVRMKEVTALLEVKRRTVERWIARGKFPAPVKIGKNSVAFPLAALVTWAKSRSVELASEFERLATTRAPDLRPEALPEQIAKQIQRESGVRPDMIMYSAVKQATPDEVNAIRVSQHLQAIDYVYQLCAELDPLDSLLVVYGLHPQSRPLLAEICKRSKIYVPENDKAYGIAVAILTASPEERAEMRKRGDEMDAAEAKRLNGGA
jgi:excisionase family DNA binding protein